MNLDLIVILVIIIGVIYYYNEKKKDRNISGPPGFSGMYKNSSLSPDERRMEYRRRGKSPSGVIDGVYNDTYREDGRPYSDVDRDWDADA